MRDWDCKVEEPRTVRVSCRCARVQLRSWEKLSFPARFTALAWVLGLKVSCMGLVEGNVELEI